MPHAENEPCTPKADLITAQVSVPAGYFGHGQLRHLLFLAALLPGALAVAEPALDGSTYWGLTDRVWFYLALAVPILQQILVVLFWRAQLCYSTVTRLFGNAGFIIWGAVFFPLLLGRPVMMVALGLADTGSLTLPGGTPLPAGLATVTGALLLVPAAYTMHSVKKYFGFARALGGDHFFERYRAMPMVRKGAFRFTSNGMYGLVFLGFWGIALLTRSQAALAAALFQHAYIWVHWYCTEQPDGVVLYGRSQDE